MGIRDKIYRMTINCNGINCYLLKLKRAFQDLDRILNGNCRK